MKRLTLPAIGVLVALVTGGFGCELLVAPDRTKIGTGGGGSEPAGGGGTGGTPTTSGGGGVGGTMTGGGGSTTGGGGTGGMPCTSPEDCGAPSGECVEKICEAMLCGETPIEEGTPIDRQVAGDCKEVQCDGRGTSSAVNDDTDLPDDGSDCTVDSCTNGVPANEPVAEGEACATNGGSLCDARGNCVECLVADDCPGDDTECQIRTCNAGVCGVMNTEQGTVVASQTDGDCKVNQCDGDGAIETVNDDDDVEDDGLECTINTCDAGENVTTNQPQNTACGEGGALFCDETDGLCKGCITPDQCGAETNPCKANTCSAEGVCGTEDKPDDTACDDGNACSQADTCQAGACTGSDPVICTASDQCHDVGTCDPGTGVCSDPAKEDGETCNDGDACTTVDTCQAGTCTGASPVVCMAQDQCHDAGTCDPGTGACSNPAKPDDTSCDDSNACTTVDTCQAGTCTGASPVVCTAQDQCHDVGVCDTTTGICSNPNKTDGTSCSDDDACTTVDTCQAGTCTGASPVVCTASDQCHDVGVCDTTTGVCSNPVKADGASCSDDDACTTVDTCQAGACTGGSPVVCTASDQCHDAGTCDTTTGVCSNPAKTDGTSCNDDNACTTVDTCQAGACTGGSPVVCTASDQCHDPGTCDTTTGVCSNPAKADGASCSDDNACTTVDTCQSGTCTGASPVVCTALDECHVAGICNTATGLCSNPNAPNDTVCTAGGEEGICTDGTCVTPGCTDDIQNGDESDVDCGGSCPNKCANGDTCNDDGDCASNTCVGGTCVECDAPSDCPAGNQCQDVTCVANVCGFAPATDGTSCNDANACTQADTCQAGVCTGANPVVCMAQDQCHDAGTCNPATGVCSNPNKTDGTSCNDNNACTQTDTCQSGTCTGADPVVCTAQDTCHDVGTCDTGTGLCSNPVKADGAPCSDGNACTQTDTCESGTCMGANPVVCVATDQCHAAGTCDTGTGLCSNPEKADGATCDDNDACTQTDSCQSGTCTGANPIVCTASDQCHDAGTCNPATGTCSNPNKPDGTTCTDPTVCTADDECQAGVCTGTNEPPGTPCSEGGGSACNGAGACVVAPAIASTTPADGAANVSALTTVAVTFTKAMNPATLTGQTELGACTGSIQLSSNEFASCVPFSAAAPVMNGSNTTATFTPAPALAFGTTYKLKVLASAADAVGVTIGSDFTQPAGFATGLDAVAGSGVVISQVYGGGGNSSAQFQNDFVELHNRGASDVNISGWSVQVTNATGATWNVRTFPTGTILGAGQYFLIAEAAGAGGNGAPLPTPDFIPASPLNFGQNNGKAALVNNSTQLTGACPSGPAIVDFVGVGTGGNAPNCSETAPAPSMSNTSSSQRKGLGCQDTNNNSNDFASAAPIPRNTASTALVCSVSVNETNTGAELDYCNVQFPTSIDVAVGAMTPTIYAQAYEAGSTEAGGAATNLIAQFGYGPTTANPQNQPGWTWVNGTFNVQVDNNDEWQAQLIAPTEGTYRYGARFSYDGVQWTYCDLNGAGSNPGLAFQNAQLPTMTVTP